MGYRWRVLLGVLTGTIVGCGVIAAVQYRDEIGQVHRWNTVKTVTLPQGRKIVGVTWKDGNLWVLTRPAAEIEIADEIMHLDEHSGWGVLSGHIIVQETKVEEERR